MDVPKVRKGRGAVSSPPGRFEPKRTDIVDDGWGSSFLAEAPDSVATEVQAEHARTIITRNDSPDISFEQSINPYRGCEHGCVYCYARPSHAYVGLSPGLDFETRLFYKKDAVGLLETELAKPGYWPKPIMLGSNTDPYQPIERRLSITRGLLEVFARTRHPVSIVTKGALIARDLELLTDLARDRLTRVMISIPTLSDDLKRTLEPRAASPAARLRVMERLASAGIPVGVLVAPVIPVLTDHELEAILEAVSAAGGSSAGYVVLRLPYEVAPLFREWLATHHSGRAQHVMARVQDLRGGRDNDSTFSRRMTGQGVYAALLKQRFRVATSRLKLDTRWEADLDTSHFRAPAGRGGAGQMSLDW